MVSKAESEVLWTYLCRVLSSRKSLVELLRAVNLALLR